LTSTRAFHNLSPWGNISSMVYWQGNQAITLPIFPELPEKKKDGYFNGWQSHNYNKTLLNKYIFC
jgi:hypothetical protein